MPGMWINTGSFPLASGDTLMLCSDGISDVLEPEIIQDVLFLSEDPANHLVKLAIQNKTRDN